MKSCSKQIKRKPFGFLFIYLNVIGSAAISEIIKCLFQSSLDRYNREEQNKGLYQSNNEERNGPSIFVLCALE